jgi:hypothetical protein
MWTSICAALALAPSVYAVPAFRALEPRDADPLKVLTEERLAKRDGHIVNLIQEEYNLPSVEVTVGGQTLTLSMSKKLVISPWPYRTLSDRTQARQPVIYGSRARSFNA